MHISSAILSQKVNTIVSSPLIWIFLCVITTLITASSSQCIVGDLLEFVDEPCGFSELIVSQTDVTQARFSSSVRSTYLENEDNPEADTFTNVGNLDESDFLFDDGYFYFKLIYDSSTTIVWRQTSWLTTGTITGYDPISVPPQPNASPCAIFGGLGLSNYYDNGVGFYSFLDGNADETCWWNSVGTIEWWNGGLIPSFNQGTATSSALYVYAPISTAECEAPAQFIWEDLMQTETGKPNAVATLSVDEATLSLNVNITADYLGFSAADSNGYLYGTTYVIDFEDFDAHQDSIREPGTCQNREDVLGGATWSEVWSYSEAPNTVGNIGSTNYLAYAPGNLWTVEMAQDDVCSVKYSTTLTWSQLTSCTDYNGVNGLYITTSDNANNITLSGTLYINVVSPYDYAADYGYYRVYQLLSQPFMIVVSKTTYVLGEVGINLLTMDMIAVYKEDEENTFRLIVLTESAEYLELSRDTLGETSSLFQVFAPSDASNPITSANFRMLEPAETLTSGCLGNKQYICSQLWQITADDVECTTDGIFTDFSGTYSIQFSPQCRSAADLGGDTALNDYCTDWLADHLDEITDSTAGDKVLLSAGLSWRDEICDPQIFTVQFSASMQFYADAAFSNEVVDPYLFQVGEDVIYVKVTTDYPTTTLSVFATELLNVWICTFDPLNPPDAITVDSQEGGCFDPDADDNSANFLDHIYDLENNVEQEGFALDTSSSLLSNEIQFEFAVPAKVHRDTLYIHAQIEVSLSSGRRRRRMLSAQAAQANQMEHFVNKVGIGSPDDDNHPHQPFEAPQAPISPPSQPWSISLQSPWLIAVGCLLAVVLTANIIFIFYANCIQSGDRRSKYKRIIAVDSDEASEHDAINVVSN